MSQVKILIDVKVSVHDYMKNFHCSISTAKRIRAKDLQYLYDIGKKSINDKIIRLSDFIQAHDYIPFRKKFAQYVQEN